MYKIILAIYFAKIGIDVADRKSLICIWDPL
jgi:hypothetical protein